MSSALPPSFPGRRDAGLSNQVRAVRMRLGLSQQELAGAAGVTRQTVSGLESGQFAPSAAVALRLARALGCPVEQLFWLDEEPEPLSVTLSAPADDGARVALVRVGDRWVAHPLTGRDAFRTEMVPCDGILSSSSVGDPGAPRQTRPLADLATLENTVALAGCTPVLSLWARAAERWHPGLRVLWSFANTTEGLRRLARGHVHAAGVHARDPASGEENAPFVRRELPATPVTLVHLGRWEEGLLVARGNPLGLRDAADLGRAQVSVINREVGAGSRLLLDECLADAGVPAPSVRGYDRVARGHLEVAETVARGDADAGVSSRSVAEAYGLDFLPLREVGYELAIPRDWLSHPPVQHLLGTLDHRWVRSQFSVLGGYDTRHTGSMREVSTA